MRAGLRFDEMIEQEIAKAHLDSVKAPLLFRHVQSLDLQQWRGSSGESVFARLVEDVAQLARSSPERDVTRTPSGRNAPTVGAAPEKPDPSLRQGTRKQTLSAFFLSCSRG